MADTLFDDLGGMPCLEKVHKAFYQKLLSYPWLKDFFTGVPRQHLESQQSEFMAGVFGGPKIYGGRPPKTAHMHMFITEEVFLIRHRLLEQTLTEANIRTDLKEKWLGHDMAMKKVLVKNAAAECQGRYKSENIIVVEKPREQAVTN